MFRYLLHYCTLVVGAFLSGLVLASSAIGTDTANIAACSNEASPAFRAYLSDCRGYEMVSSPFKDGYQNAGVVVSNDGSHVLEETKGAFAGTESDSPRAVYQLTRLGTGWVTSAISPSASLFPAQTFFAASADLRTTLWAMRDTSQSIYAEDLYVREVDGSFVKVGSMVPPAAATGPPAGGYQFFARELIFGGASSELSHVLFNIRGSGALWPGDTTVQGSTNESLYEYAGTGNEQPQLVGVNAEGHLISECTIRLGSEQGDTYNALSASGKTVFFTAQGHSSGCNEAVKAPQASELYARLGQIETVAISEPSPGQCRACNTAIKAPAEFQGASEDGSKVFFLTGQELFSGDTTMNLYEYDFNNPAGRKVVRVSVGSSTPEVQGVARESEDGSHVYFVAKGVLTEGENPEGGQPVTGGDNLYVFERDAAHPGGRVAFVATLSEADAEDWKAQDERPVQATPDGRFVVFQSVADLTPGDTSSEPQVFEYDALEGKLVRVSVGQVGYTSGTANANAHGSRITIQEYVKSFTSTTETNGLAVSADGLKVVFSSAGALTPEAEGAAGAGAQSVYEHRSVGSIANGNVYLISDGTNRLDAKTIGLDASGGDIFFETADPLLAQDVDTQFDIYDARAGGGFPAPAAQAACQGEACQGPPPTLPTFDVPGSVSQPGGGNLSSPPSPMTRPKAKPLMRAKPLTRAQRLAKALKVCGKKPKKKRAVCESQARKRYSGKTNVEGMR
jgi:hypothetical protein